MELKIPFYNILNMLVTGVVFFAGIIIIFPEYFIRFIASEIINGLDIFPDIALTIFILAVAYETGTILNRIGSIIVEPILKSNKIIEFNDDYERFNIKKKEYPILETLSREYASSRTRFTMFMILSLITLIRQKHNFVYFFIFISIMYLLSMRKHSSKILMLTNNTEAKS